MSYCRSFNTLQGLALRCLLVHFPSSTAVLVLQVGSLLGGCRCLDMLLAWSLQNLLSWMGPRLGMGMGWFTGLVVLDLVGKEFDKQKNHAHLVVLAFNLDHVCGRECIL